VIINCVIYFYNYKNIRFLVKQKNALFRAGNKRHFANFYFVLKMLKKLSKAPKTKTKNHKVRALGESQIILKYEDKNDLFFSEMGFMEPSL